MDPNDQNNGDQGQVGQDTGTGVGVGTDLPTEEPQAPAPEPSGEGEAPGVPPPPPVADDTSQEPTGQPAEPEGQDNPQQ